MGIMEIAFRPDPARTDPVYRQLAGHLGSLISSGQLPAGTKLPPSRELARSLGISRNTVNGAYQVLADGEWVVAHVGRGTFVADRPRVAAVPSPDAGSHARAFLWEGLFAAQPRRPERISIDRRPSVRFDFRGGRVDVDALPVRALRECFAGALANDLGELANNPDPRGWGPLREVIASRLVARGIRCEADEIVITSGAQQALDLLSRVLLDPGEAAATERPGYFGAEWAFRAVGAHAVPIPVDEEGLRTDALAQVLRGRRLKLVYCTPAVQSPTGVTLSDARREELLALAEAHQLPILEDDYDGDMRLAEPIVPALKTLDSVGQVITVGTFAKAVFPTLRIGYVVGAHPLVRRLAEAKLTADMGTGHLAQAALARWIANGGLDRHVRATRRDTAERIDAVMEAIAEEMPEGTEVARPAGGHAVWVKLPPEVDPDALRNEAWANDLSWSPPETFLPGQEGAGFLHLSVALLPPGDVREGIARLGQIARRLAATRRRRAASA